MQKKTHGSMAAALGLLLAAGALPARAEDHTNIFTCYAYVHGQCYGNGENNCSEDDYDWGLDQCDQSYPKSDIERPARPAGLSARQSDSRIKATIERTFEKRR